MQWKSLPGQGRLRLVPSNPPLFVFAGGLIGGVLSFLLGAVHPRKEAPILRIAMFGAFLALGVAMIHVSRDGSFYAVMVPPLTGNTSLSDRHQVANWGVLETSSWYWNTIDFLCYRVADRREYGCVGIGCGVCVLAW